MTTREGFTNQKPQNCIKAVKLCSICEEKTNLILEVSR